MIPDFGGMMPVPCRTRNIDISSTNLSSKRNVHCEVIKQNIDAVEFIDRFSDKTRWILMDSAKRETHRFSICCDTMHIDTHLYEWWSKASRLTVTNCVTLKAEELQPTVHFFQFFSDFVSTRKLLKSTIVHGMPGMTVGELPFDFMGGLVGHVSYEMKSESFCGYNQEFTTKSLDPEASLWNIERWIVWDHQESLVYIMSIGDNVSSLRWIELMMDTMLQNDSEETSLIVNNCNLSIAPTSNCKMSSNNNNNCNLSSNNNCNLYSADKSKDPDIHLQSPNLFSDEEHHAQNHNLNNTIQDINKEPYSPLPISNQTLDNIQKFINETSVEYKQKIKQCQDFILEGETYQVCLTQQLEFPISLLQSSQSSITNSYFNLYLKLRHNNPAGYGMYIENSKNALLSSSPELFLQVNSCGRILMKPIKGTIDRILDDMFADKQRAEHLQRDVKNRAENLMIVDLIRNDLNLICSTDSVTVTQLMEIETLASVHQLVTSVEGLLKSELDAFDVLKNTFPPGFHLFNMLTFRFNDWCAQDKNSETIGAD